MRNSKYSAAMCALGALIVFLLYYADIYNWSGVTMSGGHWSESYSYINGVNDLGSYMKNACGLLDGTWPVEPFFRAPLYSFFLAAFLYVFDSVAWMALVQIFFAVGIVWMTCRISALLFDRATGIAASVMLMLYGGFVFITVVLHTALMEVFFAVLAFYALLLLRRDFNFKNAVYAGVTAALAALIRPNYLLVSTIAIICAYIEYLYSEGCITKLKIDTKKLLKLNVLLKPLPALLAFFLVLSPFIIWNNLHSSKPVFITTNAAVTWKLSNSYDSPSSGIVLISSEPLMPVTSAAFWKHQAVKTMYYMKSLEVPQNVNYYIFLHYSDFLKFLPLNFGFINALFLASLCFYFRNWRKLWPIAIYTIGYAATVIAFNVTGRYRLPAVPLMLIPAGAFLLHLWRMRSLWLSRGALKGNEDKNIKSEKKKIIASVAVFALLFILFEPWSSADNFNSWGNQARRSIFALNISEYRYCVSRMYNISPGERNVRMMMVAASAMDSDFNTASQLIQNELRLYPDSVYLEQTATEIEILRKASEENKSMNSWLAYLKNTNDKGFLGGYYTFYLNTIAKRAELGLTVDNDNKHLLELYQQMPVRPSL